MSERRISITERAAIPASSILLGYGPVLLTVFGTAASWAADGSRRASFAHLTIIWAATILAFLAGVRRGLSFRTQGGAAPAQIATMMVFFALALLALVALSMDLPRVAAALLVVGYGLAAILDPIAAAAGQAPLFFERLRPPQMTIAAVSLGALLFVLR